jgi:hypothetical protein
MPHIFSRLFLVLALISILWTGVASQMAFAEADEYGSERAGNGNAPASDGAVGGDSGSSDSGSSAAGESADIVPATGEGGVRVNNLANIEALLNIIANGLEIMGIANVGNFFAGAVVLFVKRKPLFGGIMLAMCPVSVTFGLATPGLINWLVASAHDANWFSSEAGGDVNFLIAAPFVLIAALIIFGIGFIPAIVAFRRKSEYRWPIFFSTFVAWLVPFGWPALLFWALWESESRADSPAQA